VYEFDGVIGVGSVLFDDGVCLGFDLEMFWCSGFRLL